MGGGAAAGPKGVAAAGASARAASRLSVSPADFLFKFLVIGSAGTGKSCLLHQFIESKCESPAVGWGTRPGPSGAVCPGLPDRSPRAAVARSIQRAPVAGGASRLLSKRRSHSRPLSEPFPGCPA